MEMLQVPGVGEYGDVASSGWGVYHILASLTLTAFFPLIHINLPINMIY